MPYPNWVRHAEHITDGFLRWHYPDQVREATLMDFLGYYLSPKFGTPTDNGKQLKEIDYTELFKETT